MCTASFRNFFFSFLPRFFTVRKYIRSIWISVCSCCYCSCCSRETISSSSVQTTDIAKVIVVNTHQDVRVLWSLNHGKASYVFDTTMVSLELVSDPPRLRLLFICILSKHDKHTHTHKRIRIRCRCKNILVIAVKVGLVREISEIFVNVWPAMPPPLGLTHSNCEKWINFGCRCIHSTHTI